jgi:dienelactone hydrolase
LEEGIPALPVTREPGGVSAYDLSADGDVLAYTGSTESRPSGDWSDLRTRFKGVNYQRGLEYLTPIYRLDLKDWRVELIKRTRGAIHDGFDFSVSPDGRRIALAIAPEDRVESYERNSTIRIIDIASGKETDLPDDQWRLKRRPYGEVEMPTWSADGSAIAFFIGHDGYPNQVFIAESSSGTYHLFPLTAPLGTTFRSDGDAEFRMQWLGKERTLAVLCDDHARSRVYAAHHVSLGASIVYESLTKGDEVVDWFSASPDGGAISCVTSAPQHVWEIAMLANGSARIISRANAQVESWKTPQIQIKSWKNGAARVEGVVELPYNYDCTHPKPVPLVVNLHGGPTTSWHCNLIYGYLGSVLFSSQGYAFFSPNFRGSTGYGDAFVTDLIGKQNSIEVEDVLAGIDELCRENVTEANRVGLIGWSYGGYLTNCLMTRRGRTFKCASSGGCVTDYVLEWGASDEPAFEPAFLGGLPWEVPNEYRRTSPIFNFGGVRTPTVFHVGSDDPRCPVANSQLAYRSLKAQGIPSELLVYPNESHGLNKFSSRKAKMSWDLEWFKKYLPVGSK